MTEFPDDFLWGAATAGHQVEGANVNADLWPLEWAPQSLFKEPSGVACDHYHRYTEDVAIMADLGFNAYRFSLEWSRIEPEPGYYSGAELDHYRRMMACCLEHGITPVVTYNHFTTPRWFAGDGGWGDARSPDRFTRFAARATEHLGDLLSWVATLNEPNLMAMLGATGRAPVGDAERALDVEMPGTSVVGVGGYDSGRYRFGLIAEDVERMSAAHRGAVDAIKSAAPHAQVGWTLALVDLQPAEGGDERWERSRRVGQLDWLDVSRDDDFVGVQTYSRNVIGPDGAIEPGDDVPKMQTGWEVYPDALEHTVRLAAERAAVPVVVTENGMATD